MIQRAVGLIPRIIAGSSLDDESGDFARMLADQEAMPLTLPSSQVNAFHPGKMLQR